MNENKTMKPYDSIGGEESLKKIVHRFYEIMSTQPEVHALRAMHPTNIEPAQTKLFEFLSGWLGGPNLFIEKYGHPRLRARHLPFKISKVERDQWMICMVQAFEDCGVQEPVRSEILHALLNLADHMRNQGEK